MERVVPLGRLRFKGLDAGGEMVEGAGYLGVVGVWVEV